MKSKFFLFSFLITLNFSIADGLENSLNNLLNKKDTSTLVNIGDINLNGKAKIVKKTRKKRSSKTIVAKVDGISIRKKNADTYLKKVTQGKIKDFDLLAKKQKKLLIQDLARPLILKNAAKRDIVAGEKLAVYRQMWLEKEMLNTSVSNEEMLELYTVIKKKTLAQNPKAKIPAYISLGKSLKKQVIEEKIMTKLMKNVKIKMNIDLNTSFADTDIIGTVNDISIFLKEANEAVKILTKGKMTWEKLPQKDKNKFIKMIAPTKLIGFEAEKNLTAKEKEMALSNFWIQKKMSQIKVSDKEAKNLYSKMKKAAKNKQKFPSFMQIKNNIKMQIAQDKTLQKLIKKVKIILK